MKVIVKSNGGKYKIQSWMVYLVKAKILLRDCMYSKQTNCKQIKKIEKNILPSKFILVFNKVKSALFQPLRPLGCKIDPRNPLTI